MKTLSNEIKQSLEKISDSLNLVVAFKKNESDKIEVFATPTMDGDIFMQSIKEAKCVKNVQPQDFPNAAKKIEEYCECNILDELSNGACFMYVEEADQECWYFAG